MVISISLLLLLLVLAVIFLRGGGLKISHAIVCALLGFTLASTSIAPTIQQGIVGTARMVSTIHP